MVARCLIASLAAFLIALPLAAQVGAHATVLAEYDFDSVAGEPDPQGWRALHRLQSVEAIFGHVDDAAGLGRPLAPLAASPSFWFGLSAADPRTCGWESPPGYDNLVVQYLGASGVREKLANFSCQTDDCVASLQNLVIPSTEHAGTLSVRLYFNFQFIGDARRLLPPFTQNVFGVLLDDITWSDATSAEAF